MVKYGFADCELDTTRGLLRVAGADVPLRPKAMALLLHLLERRGRLVTKDELLEALWPGVTVTADSLTQAVLAVRRAIGTKGGAILRTVPRRGYLIEKSAVRILSDPPFKPSSPHAITDRI